MRRPSFAIASLMGSSALIAIDCVPIRWLILSAAGSRALSGWSFACISVLPMANLLALLVLTTPRRRPAWGPFPIGVQVFGWSVILAVLAFGWAAPAQYERSFMAISLAVNPRFHASFPRRALETLPLVIWYALAIIFDLGIPLSIISAPMGAVSLLGGWVMSRFRGTRVGSPREDAGPGLAAVAATGWSAGSGAFSRPIDR